MIDKEKEIVQALRCCAEGECKDCAMHEDKQRCQENLLDKAAEVIERLTDESADTWRRYDGIAMRDCLGSIVTQWMSLPEAPEEEGKA